MVRYGNRSGYSIWRLRPIHLMGKEFEKFQTDAANWGGAPSFWNHIQRSPILGFSWSGNWFCLSVVIYSCKIGDINVDADHQFFAQLNKIRGNSIWFEYRHHYHIYLSQSHITQNLGRNCLLWVQKLHKRTLKWLCFTFSNILRICSGMWIFLTRQNLIYWTTSMEGGLPDGILSRFLPYSQYLVSILLTVGIEIVLSG